MRKYIGMELISQERPMRVILRELEKARWSVPRGFSVMSIREDRDSG